MSRRSKGTLVILIDVNGENVGLGIYMGLHPPGFLPSEGKQFDTFWHFSVIDTKGELKYLSTHNWTLIPADPDSCNP